MQFAYYTHFLLLIQAYTHYLQTHLCKHISAHTEVVAPSVSFTAVCFSFAMHLGSTVALFTPSDGIRKSSQTLGMNEPKWI